MDMDRRTLVGLGALALTLPASAGAQSTGGDSEIALWPKGAPGGQVPAGIKPAIVARPTDGSFMDRYAEHTTRPLMTLFRAPKPNGAALLIVPGGGYVRSMVDNEGFELAERFRAAGITCFVLRYRFPADGWAAGPDAPLQDAQRALRLIRHGAATYGIDPKRVGVIGASAGGHLAASLITSSAKTIAPPIDAADRLEARPDFGALLYPVITMTEPQLHRGSRTQLIGENPAQALIDAYSIEKRVTGAEPPTFFVHAADDKTVPIENSLMLAESLRRAKVPTELHLFEEGGHGFGVRAKGKPVFAWPDLFLTWVARHGWLRGA